MTRQEAIKAGVTHYDSAKPCSKCGFSVRIVSNSACVRCSRIISKKRTRKLRKINPEYREKRRAYFAKLREDKTYVSKLRSIERQRYATDPEYRANRLANAAAYRARNHQRLIARNMARHAAKMQRTPGWADLRAINEFYEDRPTGHHVDHILPLQGETVSGLHVLENLQYLPAADNIRKSNKLLDHLKGAEHA